MSFASKRIKQLILKTGVRVLDNFSTILVFKANLYDVLLKFVYILK